MVAVLWTPPSRLPSGLNLNRASRTGPYSVMKKGTRSVPPSFEENATCGFTAGLLPPVPGWLWQPAQLSRFIRGPSPSATTSTSSKSALPSVKKADCLAVNPAIGPPAPAGPPRTPGSRAVDDSWDDAISICKENRAATAAAKDSGAISLLFMVAPSLTSNTNAVGDRPEFAGDQFKAGLMPERSTEIGSTSRA